MLWPNDFDLEYMLLIPGIYGYSKHSETTLLHAFITQIDAKALSQKIGTQEPMHDPSSDSKCN